MADDEKGLGNKTCEFATRPFDADDPGICGAPATKVIYDGLLGRDKDGKPWPFYICEKHWREVESGPRIRVDKLMD